MAVVTVFPRVLATTRVLPDADGVGFSRSISMQSLFPLISTVIAMVISPVQLLVDCLAKQGARLEGQDLSGGDSYRLAGLRIPSLAAVLFVYDKAPEAGNLHGFGRLKGLLDCFQDCFQIREGFIFAWRVLVCRRCLIA
jgi:hypothetical protein